MKSIKFFCCLFFVLSIIPSYGQEIEAQIHKQIKKLLRYEVDVNKKETPGFIVAIIEPDTSFVVSYGKQVGKRIKPDSSETFELGGLSKTMSAIVVNNLVNRGILKLDDRLATVFPKMKNTPLENITLIQLLQHTSGIKRGLKGIVDNKERKLRGLALHSPKGFSSPMEELTSEELWKGLLKTELGESNVFHYSHYNYGILSEWVETKTGKSIAIWSKEINVGDKKLNSITKKELITAKGLTKHGESKKNISYGVLENSMGLESNIENLIYLIRSFYLDETNPLASSILSNPIETEIAEGIYFTQGLYKIKQKDYTIYSHGGHSLNHSASIHFVPETKTGLVILANSEIGTKDLYVSLLAMINNNWKREPYGQEK